MFRSPSSIANAACLAIMLAWSVAAPLRLAGGRSADPAMYPEAGEILTHRIPALVSRVSFRLPLATISSALAVYHSGARYEVLLAAHLALAVLLVFAIGLLLHPWGGAIAAAAVAAWSFGAPLGSDLYAYPNLGYFILVLLSAGLLVWRSRAPSPGRTLLLAAAVGATLLWRSSLAFFTPALAVYEWASEHRSSFGAYRRQFLILCVVPYLFLLPWIAMNWTVQRRLVIFEKGAASSNIVTGALGLVQNIEGDIGALIDEPINVRNDGAVLGWAVREVLHHPLRFTRAYIRRLTFALTLQPWTALLAAAGLWAFRRRREHRMIAFMAAYFLAVYCLMAVQKTYFWPPLALLTLLAASLPAGLLSPEGPRDGAPEPRLASAVLKGALALVAAFVINAQWTLLAFARASRRPAGIEEQLSAALRSHPDDAWLLVTRGLERSNRGDGAGAAADFSRAAALRPENPRPRLLLARAEALSGKPGLLLAWISPPGNDKSSVSLLIEANMLQALEYIHLGRKREARERLKEAWDIHSPRQSRVRGPHGVRENQAAGRLRTSDAGFIHRLLRLEGRRPPAEQRALDEVLASVVPDVGRIRIEREHLTAWLASRDGGVELPR